MNGHISAFALDVHWAEGRPPGDLEAHVATCERCRGYLASLDASARREHPPPRIVVSLQARRPRNWVLPIFSTIALAAGVALFVKAGAPREYVGTKGTPAVELFIERDHRIDRWDERTPVHPNDRLALHVACEDFPRVVVAAPVSGVWTTVFDGPCPLQSEALPFSLTVDDQPGDEHLALVWSKEPMKGASLARAIDERRRQRGVWVTTLDLKKTAP